MAALDGNTLHFRLPWHKPRLRIFMSYRHTDSSGYANSIYHSLVANFGKAQVFKDVNTITPGEQWEHRLDETLSNCDVVVVVIGPGWVTANDGSGRRLENPEDWVRRELERALARDVPVVPTLVGGAPLPEPADLPATLQPLLRRQSIELNDVSWNADLKRLVQAFNEFAASLRDPAHTKDVNRLLDDALKHWQRVPRRARMTFLVGLGTLFVVLIGVGFVIHWLLIGAAIAGLVWLITKFTKRAREEVP